MSSHISPYAHRGTFSIFPLASLHHGRLHVRDDVRESVRLGVPLDDRGLGHPVGRRVLRLPGCKGEADERGALVHPRNPPHDRVSLPRGIRDHTETREPAAGPAGKSAPQILDERYAKGEISPGEYQRMKEDLKK
ncbi:MAG: SHOCT domain-containing protein [Methanomicrobiales archaeon]